VRATIDLIAKRAIESRMPMPVHVAPERADAIEIPLSVRVDEEIALTTRDHERRPLRHLRERMPGYPLVQFLEIVHIKL